jgi:hypothetical protein
MCLRSSIWPILERTLAEYQPRLVIIDPIQSYLGSGVDMHRANETRPLLEALRRLAEEYQCAIVCIRHPAKSSQGGKAIHRGLGSVDFIGAARTGLFVEQHPTDPTKALFAQSKSNIGPLGRTQVFAKAQGQFQWCGISRLSAELLAGSGRGPDPHIFLEAVCWLEERLSDGIPVSSEVLRAEAEEQGLTISALHRAKKALGIRSIKQGDQWDWQLLGLTPIPMPNPLCSLASLALLRPLEHLQANQAVTMQGPSGCPPQDARECAHTLETIERDGSTQEENATTAEPIENMEDAQVTQVGQVRQVVQEVIPPCYRCGGTDRYVDGSVYRCRQCWPPREC